METWVFSQLSRPGQCPKPLRPLGLLNLRRRMSYFATSESLDRGSHSRCKLVSINSRCWQTLHQSPCPEKEPLDLSSPKSRLMGGPQQEFCYIHWEGKGGRGREGKRGRVREVG